MTTRRTTSKKRKKKRAPAAKGAKQESRAKSDLQESWRADYAGLLEGCRTRFAFLESQHAFAPPELEVQPPEGTVVYRHAEGATLRINSEYLCEPWVVVTGGSPPGYGVHELIAERLPSYQERFPSYQGRSPSDAERDAILDYYADFLRDHGEDMLRADPGLFARLAARRASGRK